MKHFVLLVLLLSSGFASAQKQYKVLDWKGEYSLNTFLMQEVHSQYEERERAVSEAIASRETMLKYQAKIRNSYKNILGDLPQETPLNAQVIGEIVMKGYRIEKVIYESLPGHHVTSNLYIPDGTGPFPGVLLFCGHEMEAKATESYQKTATLFALNGFVVLVIDPLSQGERIQLTDNGGKTLTRGSTTEHTVLNAGANILGTSIAAYQYWDNKRSLDYLVSRPEVNKEKIGCLGNSGGGTQTAYFVAADDRIKVAAPCSFIARRERNLELQGAADGCQHVPFEGREGLEISDFLLMAAPKPLLILAGRYDFVDYTGAMSVHQEMKKMYATFGSAEKADMFTFDDGHGISKPKREAAVTWFSRWLLNDINSVKEGDLQTLSPEQLNCTATGQVNTAFSGERNITVLNTALAESFTRTTRKPDLVTIKSIISFSDNKSTVIPEYSGTVTNGAVSINKVILRKENEIPLPALIVSPPNNRKVDKVVIWVYPKGKNQLVDSVNFLKSYADKNVVLILADLRGMGETTDPAALNDPKYFSSEYRNAMTAIHIGKPLIGQRVTDIVTILDFIKSDKTWKGAPIEVVASGMAAPIALHAAVLDSRIDRLELINGISSFKEIIEKPLVKDWYSFVVPGVLKNYDLPDLQNLIKEKVIVKTL